jgi:hypothetical protein
VADPAQVERLEAVPDGERFGGEGGFGQLLDAELTGQVDQRERVATRRRDDLRCRRRIEDLRQGRPQQPDRRFGSETSETEFRYPRHLRRQTGIVAAGENNRGRLRFQSSGNERQHVQRLGIQQVRVVNRAHDRLYLARGCQHPQHAQPDQEPVRWRAVSHRCRHLQRLLMAARKQGQVRTQRDHQALQGGERDCGLSLVAIDPQLAHTGRTGQSGFQQRGLSYPWLAGHKQRTAAPISRVPKQTTDLSLLSIPPEQTPLYSHDC